MNAQIVHCLYDRAREVEYEGPLSGVTVTRPPSTRVHVPTAEAMEQHRGTPTGQFRPALAAVIANIEDPVEVLKQCRGSVHCAVWVPLACSRC